jgi:hypothetical protein
MKEQAKCAGNSHPQALRQRRRTNTCDLQQVLLLLAELQLISKAKTAGLDSHQTLATKPTEVVDTVPKVICRAIRLV